MTPPTSGNTLFRFDTREEFDMYIINIAEAVRGAIKQLDRDFLSRTVDELFQLIEDVKKDFIVREHGEEDIETIQTIITAAQERMYG